MKDFNEQAKELLIFSHIPKTAGSTMRQILKKQYEKKKIIPFRKIEELDEQQLAQAEAVYGHIRFGAHKYFSQPFTYITMLRDPVERIISNYYFSQRRPSNRMHESAKSLDFLGFVKQEIEANNPSLHNHQTRFVSGAKNPDLELAKQNIHEHYAVVGLSEMFDESVFLMKTFLGWDDIFYTKTNVTKNRPKQFDLPHEAIAILKEYNQLDYELYHYAKEVLNDNLKALDSESKKELKRYKKQGLIFGED
ncbi:sulfotransferase family 2 domain-containing protein [Bacillus sp. JJ1562]|uniref:sulfotransferase family 2 domain-containing protein n=1 Tax=Bacillus sp. JJ1562 TaxID=3122960 RepID=UPI003001D499